MHSIKQNKTVFLARKKFLAMAAAYCLGVFNDNYFKQAAMLLAVTAGLSHLQGWATVLFAAPFILFSSLGGWCADRFTKKKVVIAAKGMEVAAMSIGAVGLIFGEWPCVLAMVFAMGLQSAFFNPSLNGAIPELYPSDYVPRANAGLKLVSTLAILIGVALAGVTLDIHALEHLGLTGPHLVAALALCCSIAGLIASWAVDSGPASNASRPFPWWGPVSSLKDLSRIVKDRELLLALSANTFFYFIASMTILLVNTMAIEEFHFSQTQASILSMALMLGVCGGSFPAAKKMILGRWSRFLAPSAMGMAAGFFLVSRTSLAPIHYQWHWMAASLFLTGIAGGLFLIPVASMLQIRPAETEKGRVLGASSFCSFVAILLSGLLFNFLHRHITPGNSMYFLSLAALSAAGVLLLTTGVKEKIARLAISLVKQLLKVRYKITVRGLSGLALQEERPILFLPNHPALIDPVILLSTLHKRFQPCPLAAAEQVDRPVIRRFAKLFNVIKIHRPMKRTDAAKTNVQEAFRQVVDTLKKGRNVLLYPGGKLMRSGCESLGGNSGVSAILKQVPEVQIVLVKTTGLWGSSFSWASGETPTPGKHVGLYLKSLMGSGFLFMPKRQVTLEFFKDKTLHAMDSRKEINKHLEGVYNRKEEHGTSVPYFWWQGRVPKIMRDSRAKKIHDHEEQVPGAIREQVFKKIEQETGIAITEEQSLGRDLALDSLTILDITSWLETEFGVSIPDPALLETVGDCIRAASGIPLTGACRSIAPPPSTWHRRKDTLLAIPAGETIAETFIRQAIENPGRVIVADPISGIKTYRQLLTAIFALRPSINQMAGRRIGVMLPPSVSSVVAYFAILLCGKTPVFLNWTTGYTNVRHAIDVSGVTHVLSAAPLLKKAGSQQGADFAGMPVEWFFMEQFAGSLTAFEKIRAYARARFFPRSILKTDLPETAAILFTSGSEARPKAVPLTHTNIMTNLCDMAALVQFQEKDCLLGMLPPFHSLGLSGTIILPLCMGLRTVYYPNPTEPALLTQIIEKFRVSTLITTPTFLQGILSAAGEHQLDSIQRVFTGAEKCPQQVLNQLSAVNPKAHLCEGYGITECSPLVSLNTPRGNRHGTIGRVLPSVTYAVVDDRFSRRVAEGRQGLLLVRGPSIFSGYLEPADQKPFCRFEGEEWYYTGDYVSEDDQGFLTFCGRKKRFVKIGGEMISLPAIEDVILKTVEATEEGPSLAVEASAVDGHPELVLFTTWPLTREVVNTRLKAAGLSGLHNIRRVIELERIPTLGTGKTDYRQLRKLAA